MLRLRQSLTILDTTQEATRINTRRTESLEGTHIAAYVYVAALTLWAAGFYQEGPHHPST